MRKSSGRFGGQHIVKQLIAAVLLVALQISANTAALAQSGSCAGMTVGQLTSLNGFVPFDGSSLWNTDISSAPVDSNSANIINYIGSSVTLHPAFGAGTSTGPSIRLPYPILPGTPAQVTLNLRPYTTPSAP